ncbi:ferrochelatase [Neochlamydia sp. EPS4]|uniref:ferrochelatase n=1 Tax=Neochlamydia sp. EPS4 TaxID=1478175 RepID=UPI0005D1050D|nr:ferrochelatase [Neochlamydia sp. EPS4]
MYHSPIGTLLVNLGTPDSPQPKDVYKYLVEFLTDERVIDLPWLQRQLLVRGIIIPARYKQSARSYQNIWTAEGSPLMVYGKRVRDALQKALGDNFYVELAMRYRNPSLEKKLLLLLNKGIKQLIILPLFPQYASASTGSVYQKSMEILKNQISLPKITFINSFADHPAVIQAFCHVALKNNLAEYDHFLFSFHGLPQRQVTKADKNNYCLKSQNCCQHACQENVDCYSAQCHLTAHAIIGQLNLPTEKTSLAFQSRLGKDPWLEPFTPHVIKELARQNKKKILVFCPSFVCDCLETTFEIGVEYAEEFKKMGGERLDIVQGLNDETVWIKALEKIVRENSLQF